MPDYMYNVMANVIIIVGILSLLINNYSLALQIGAFNTGVYGKTKSSKPEVVSMIREIVQRYDIILLQEIRDSTEELIYDFVDVLNSVQSNYTYNLILGPRLGRTFNKEQYAYIYRSEKVQVLHSYTYNDHDDIFEREPLLVHIRDLTAKPIPDLVLVGIHVKPSDAQAELDGLVKVYEDAVKKFLTFNILLLGDMNADCSYISNRAYDQLNFTTDKRFLWLINKSKDTTVANTDCSYDRFIATLASKKLVDIDTVNVFKFDEHFNLTQTQAKQVSDHYPIELTLREECGKGKLNVVNWLVIYVATITRKLKI